MSICVYLFICVSVSSVPICAFSEFALNFPPTVLAIPAITETSSRRLPTSFPITKTYHTTFLFPLFAQPTTPSLLVLKFAHLPRSPLAHRLLRVLHPNLSHLRTFRARRSRNCALHISPRLFAASASLFVQVNIEIPARSA